MGRFDLLKGKGKDITLGDETFTIKMLDADNFGLLLDSDKNKTEAMFELVLVSLQQTDETITMDDVRAIPLKYLMQIMEVVSEVNELNQ